mgnify:CR=1 FL=1
MGTLDGVPGSKLSRCVDAGYTVSARKSNKRRTVVSAGLQELRSTSRVKTLANPIGALRAAPKLDSRRKK